MTDLNFDLNIYNYTNIALKKFLCIENNYTHSILNKKIKILKNNIFSLQLSKHEKNDFETFINKIEIRLIKDLEKIEIKRVHTDLNNKIMMLKSEIREKNITNEKLRKKINEKIKKN